MIQRHAIYGLLAGVVLLGAYTKGRADNEARHTAAALAQAQEDAEVNANLAAAEQRNRLLTQALEDAVYAEPPTATCSLPESRVLRILER